MKDPENRKYIQEYNNFFEKANSEFTSDMLNNCMVSFRKKYNKLQDQHYAIIFCGINNNYESVKKFGKSLFKKYAKAIESEKKLLSLQNFKDNQNIYFGHFSEKIGNRYENVYTSFKEEGIVNNMNNVIILLFNNRI